jgi:hypothetical protein
MVAVGAVVSVLNVNVAEVVFVSPTLSVATARTVYEPVEGKFAAANGRSHVDVPVAVSRTSDAPANAVPVQ